MNDIRAVALTGTIGAGKTTLAEAISVELHGRGIRHALLDLDWLGQVYPVPEGHDPYGYELALQNLEVIWPNFLAAGAEKVIVAGTLLDTGQKDRLQEALGGITMSIVLVEASQEIIEERIRNRDSGSLQEDFLARTAGVARNIESAGIHDLSVMNNTDPPSNVARKILHEIGWMA